MDRMEEPRRSSRNLVAARDERKKQTELAASSCVSKLDPSGFRVEFINDEIGKGVFVTKTWKEGEFLLQYPGELISWREGEKRDKIYGKKGYAGSFLYFFQCKGKFYCVDATKLDGDLNMGKMVNDAPRADPSCNCEMRIVGIEGRPYLCIFAKRKIQDGEELRYDYGVDSLPWRKKIRNSTRKRKHVENETHQIQTCEAINTNDVNSTDEQSFDPGHTSNQSDDRDDDMTAGQIQTCEAINTNDGTSLDKQSFDPGNTSIQAEAGYDDMAADKIQTCEDINTTDVNSTDKQSFDPGNTSNQSDDRVDDMTAGQIQTCEAINTNDGNSIDKQSFDPGNTSIQPEAGYDDMTDQIQTCEAINPNGVNSTDEQSFDPGHTSNQSDDKNDEMTDPIQTYEAINTKDGNSIGEKSFDPGNTSIQSQTRDNDMTADQIQTCEAINTNDVNNTDEQSFDPGHTSNQSDDRDDDMTADQIQTCEAINTNDVNSTDEQSFDPENTSNQLDDRDDEMTGYFRASKFIATNVGKSTDEQSVDSEDSLHQDQEEDEDMSGVNSDAFSDGSEWTPDSNNLTDASDEDIEDPVPTSSTYLEKASQKNNSEDITRRMITSSGCSQEKMKSTRKVPYERILSETEKLRCVKHGEVYIKKQTRSDKSKSGRAYDIVHACLYCGKLMTNIQKHLEGQHKTESEVKKVLKLKREQENMTDVDSKKKIGKVILKEQTITKNHGDHCHNSIVTTLRKGELLIARRRGGDFNSESYGACPDCLEWIVIRDNYHQHRDTCPAKNNTSMSAAVVQNLILQGKIASTESEQMKKEVFPVMTNDDISAAAMSDRLIVALGEYHFLSSIGNRLKRKNYASYRMRLAARLLLLVRHEMKSNEAAMSDCLTVEYFDVIARCAILACGKNNDNEMQHPSVAIKLGFDVAKLVACKLGYAAKERNEDDYKDAKRFQSLLTREWKIKVRKQAALLLEERQFNKRIELPDPEDIARLAQYLTEHLDEYLDKSVSSPDEYRRLGMLTQARLLLYNRRRPGELQALTIETYRCRSQGISETDLSLRAELTALEKSLLQSQELLELRGKANRRVPVLLPAEVKKPMKLLANGSVRQKCGINPNNRYLFGTSGVEPMRAGDSLDVIKHEAGLKFPLRILATNLRKHTATISQEMGLKDNELRWLITHMGHTEKVHLQHYRATSGLIERIDIAKIMLMQERGKVSKYAGVALSDIQFEDIEEDDTEEPRALPNNQAIDSVEEDIEGAEIEEENVLQLSPAKKKRTVGAGTRVPWSKEEMKEIETYFKTYISLESRRPCPGMKEILQACAKSKANGGKIWKRKWELIKKKVSYLAQKAKRQ